MDDASEREWRNAREVVLVRILDAMRRPMGRGSLDALLEDAVLVLSAAVLEIDELRGRVAALERAAGERAKKRGAS